MELYNETKNVHTIVVKLFTTHRYPIHRCGTSSDCAFAGPTNLSASALNPIIKQIKLLLPAIASPDIELYYPDFCSTSCGLHFKFAPSMADKLQGRLGPSVELDFSLSTSCIHLIMVSQQANDTRHATGLSCRNITMGPTCASCTILEGWRHSFEISTVIFPFTDIWRLYRLKNSGVRQLNMGTSAQVDRQIQTGGTSLDQKRDTAMCLPDFRGQLLYRRNGSLIHRQHNVARLQADTLGLPRHLLDQ